MTTQYHVIMTTPRWPVEDDGIDATEDVDIPESARPFHPIAFDKKKPLAMMKPTLFLNKNPRQ